MSGEPASPRETTTTSRWVTEGWRDDFRRFFRLEGYGQSSRSGFRARRSVRRRGGPAREGGTPSTHNASTRRRVSATTFCAAARVYCCDWFLPGNFAGAANFLVSWRPHGPGHVRALLDRSEVRAAAVRRPAAISEGSRTGARSSASAVPVGQGDYDRGAAPFRWARARGAVAGIDGGRTARGRRCLRADGRRGPPGSSSRVRSRAPGPRGTATSFGWRHYVGTVLGTD